LEAFDLLLEQVRTATRIVERWSIAECAGIAGNARPRLPDLILIRLPHVLRTGFEWIGEPPCADHWIEVQHGLV